MHPASQSKIPEARCTSEVHSEKETYESLQALRIIHRVMVEVIVVRRQRKNAGDVVRSRMLFRNDRP